MLKIKMLEGRRWFIWTIVAAVVIFGGLAAYIYYVGQADNWETGSAIVVHQVRAQLSPPPKSQITKSSIAGWLTYTNPGLYSIDYPSSYRSLVVRHEGVGTYMSWESSQSNLVIFIGLRSAAKKDWVQSKNKVVSQNQAVISGIAGTVYKDAGGNQRIFLGDPNKNAPPNYYISYTCGFGSGYCILPLFWRQSMNSFKVLTK